VAGTPPAQVVLLSEHAHVIAKGRLKKISKRKEIELWRFM
jgi:hypothetical protein